MSRTTLQPQKCKVSIFSHLNAAKTIYAEKHPGSNPGRVIGEMLPPLHLQPAVLHPCGKQSRKAEITTGISTPQRTEWGARAAERTFQMELLWRGAVLWNCWGWELQSLGVLACAPPASEILCLTRGSSGSTCSASGNRRSWRRPRFPPKDTKGSLGIIK